MDTKILATLSQRIDPKHLNYRRTIEEEHAAQVFGQGRNFFHIENWYSIHSLIRNTLRLCLMHGRGMRNARNIRVRYNSVQLPHLDDDLNGFTILHLSDLHADMDEATTLALMEKVRSVNYDICVMTGDYRARTYGAIDGALAGMARIRKQLRQSVYAVLGNHDSITMLPGLEEMGIQLLINESCILTRGNGKLLLAGIDDAHYYCADDITKAAESISADIPSILLSHTPAVYQQAAQAGFDLMLSGHTHGGQICLPGGVPVFLDSNCPRFVGKGEWKYQNMHGYTSVGAGTSVVNVRINCPPEITLHTLYK